MLVSRYWLGTLKEIPSDAELVSHQLMLRAGLIRKLASGLYTWLPLGLRVLQKVEAIVREEMQQAGALEILMPSVHPSSLWEESGRWQHYGPELLRFVDRHQRSFCYGPTHEEVVTDLARRELTSYKQLPITFYQIQTKFRDEIRPRFGIMRAREFIMKDAYSFAANTEDLDTAYQAMFDAYTRIFKRLGLAFRAVLADTGSIGGNYSHEFQVIAEAGEDLIVYSDSSDYAANIEKAEAYTPEGSRPDPLYPLEKVPLSAEKAESMPSVKICIVRGETHPMIALVLRSDQVLNTVKAQNLPEVASPLQYVEEASIRKQMSCGLGALGPVSLPMPCIVDRDAAQLSDFSCGANEDNFRFIHVNWQRDAALLRVADIRTVVDGDRSPDGKGYLRFARGIEVGHVFKLGVKYSQTMHATVSNAEGESVPLIMGCYGIGVSRIVAAAIEQSHDERGILWPPALAPFQVVVIPLNRHKSASVQAAAEKIYQALRDLAIEVLLDDRDERPGVLFADMDLIGIPHRLVVSERGLAQKEIEYKERCSGDIIMISVDQIVSFIQRKIILESVAINASAGGGSCKQ